MTLSPHLVEEVFTDIEIGIGIESTTTKLEEWGVSGKDTRITMLFWVFGRILGHEGCVWMVI